MYIPLTWKNDEGEVTTKSNKSELTKRLYILEHFLSLYGTCRWRLEEYKDFALLVRSGKLPTETSAYIADSLPNYRAQYIKNRQRMENMRQRLEAGNTSSPKDSELSPLQNRSVNSEQFARLLLVLRDNGIEADEAEVVAEAVFNVLDMEVDVP